jgi:predicted PurR-regulated permease PerM
MNPAETVAGCPRRLSAPGPRLRRAETSWPLRILRPVEERIVRFRPRTILSILGIVLAVAAALQLLWLARQVLTWVVIALFLALALNPLVEWLERRVVRRRVLATALAFFSALAVIAVLGLIFVPTLVDEVDQFASAVPSYVEEVTEGRGRLGFLQTEYQIVDRVEEAIERGGASQILGGAGTAVSVTRSILTIVVATITIAVLTFFMLLEGPNWISRFYSLLPEESQPRWREIGRRIYRTVGGFVSGALLIALIAGLVSGTFLSIVGVPYAIALALLVALLDLIPLAGATIAAVVVSTIAFIASGLAVGLAVLIFFVIYQQLENHILYPVVYSRTVALSPLAILIAVLIGASLAGILGALAAIPVAGAIQVILLDMLEHRRRRLEEAGPSEPLSEPI